MVEPHLETSDYWHTIMTNRISRRDLARAACAALVLTASGRPGRAAGLAQGSQPKAHSWHPSLFPEMIVKSWFQEDLAEGEVSSWQSGGVKPVAAVQAELSLRPTKLPNSGGVLFKKDTKQALTWRVDKDAPYLHRWWFVIARCNSAVNADANNVSVLCVNGAEGGSVHRQPRVCFNPSAGTFVSQVHDGKNKSEEGRCSTDFGDWNVMVGYRRGFAMQAVVNGVKTAGQTIYALRPNRMKSQSFMGDVNNPMTADVAIDCAIIGQSELNDAQIEKLMGWGMWRVGRQSALPDDHPYRKSPPSAVDASDNPARYAFDSQAWASWAAVGKRTNQAHRGQAAPDIGGYTTVFFDDFETNTIVDDLTGAQSSGWFAPTHLTNIGGDAKAQRISKTPSSYIHDADSHTLSLRLVHNKVWRTGAFSSVNNNGQGRWWGKGIFEIRAKFPKLSAPRPGFFPAFWAYGKEHLFWRTRNRLETDFWEYGGKDGTWINISQHVHKPTLAYLDPQIAAADVRRKIAGYPIDQSNGFPKAIDIYDGEFHTWYAQIEDDYTFFVIDGYEVARCATTPELAAQKYIMVNLGFGSGKGGSLPDPSETYDMVIDYIRVRQKESDLAKVPAGFGQLPELSGSASIGSTLSVQPNVPASLLEYLWYRDGIPIIGETGAKYKINASDAGHRIRCQVRALSLLDQPEAWTAEADLIEG
jgi:beta-glucanase (GH16 family)